MSKHSGAIHQLKDLRRNRTFHSTEATRPRTERKQEVGLCKTRVNTKTPHQRQRNGKMGTSASIRLAFHWCITYLFPHNESAIGVEIFASFPNYGQWPINTTYIKNTDVRLSAPGIDCHEKKNEYQLKTIVRRDSHEITSNHQPEIHGR